MTWKPLGVSSYCPLPAPIPRPNSDRERGQVDMSKLNKVFGLETDFKEEG